MGLSGNGTVRSGTARYTVPHTDPRTSTATKSTLTTILPGSLTSGGRNVKVGMSPQPPVHPTFCRLG